MREIRTLIILLRMYILCYREFPEFKRIVDLKLEEFTNDENKRDKDNCPNLADVLIFSVISDKYEEKKFKEVYNDEKMIRNVLWILKKIPEIEKPNCVVSKEDRIKISFGLAKTGGVLSLVVNHLKT